MLKLQQEINQKQQQILNLRVKLKRIKTLTK